MTEFVINNYTIVFKTYKNDLKYIKFNLLSLIKYLDFSNIYEIIFYVHDIVNDELLEIIREIKLDEYISFRVIKVHYDYHGYIKQMEIKCLCYKDCNTDYIVILDSDLLLTQTLNFDSLLSDGKIKWYYAHDNTLSNEYKVWNTAIEDSTLSKQYYHYLTNGHPFIFTKRSLLKANEHFKELHKCDYPEYMKKRCESNCISVGEDISNSFLKLVKVFGEYEYLGWWCHNYSDEFLFLDSNSNIRNTNYFIQHWSHGGITDDYLLQVKNHT